MLQPGCLTETQSVALLANSELSCYTSFDWQRKTSGYRGRAHPSHFAKTFESQPRHTYSRQQALSHLDPLQSGQQISPPGSSFQEGQDEFASQRKSRAQSFLSLRHPCTYQVQLISLRGTHTTIDSH
ncbi:hypothetical protein FGO68_gene14105 [Halteria grandinella]|uniref:Uncharacterized protein n=1 Tax=Halteria grandinella TaxID=5974 RepID=A0A8J8SUD4_HALGN|nr:hypothetical protein FGO68_gene14105 [Halteria grandinella]